jgi:non-homologous end joining protein Ku
MYMSEIDDAVDDILSQIKDHKTTTTEIKKSEEDFDADKLEEFILNKTSSLVNTSIEMVEDVRDYISSAPENRDVASLAELIRASTGAIDTLNKLHAAKEGNKSKMAIKQLDVEAKERMNIADNQTKVLLSRDDIMKALIDEEGEDVVDV